MSASEPLAYAFALPPAPATPLHLSSSTQLPALLGSLAPLQRQWIASTGFDAQPGRVLLLPGANGALAGVLVGIDPNEPLWQLAGLPPLLPAGVYAVATHEGEADAERDAFRQLGWALGALAPGRQAAQLRVSKDEAQAIARLAAAIAQVRSLVNLPANQLGPQALAAAVQTLATDHGAKYSEWVGEALPAAGFALVHAVGRSGAEAPRVAKLEWGDPAAPRIVLVGKGVCFDTGGLDLKPPAGMRWMKKDMGGAAHAIALAGLIMQAGLRVHLTLLVPAVENGVGPLALRPGDILRAGNGRLIEIENTDAEGRLVLADALHHALQHGAEDPARAPALVIDLATLTGAARVALGPELPALFSNHEGWAADLLAHARRAHDPLWRMPLWAPYRRLLQSDSADTMNAANTPLAGAITAALFLEDFVPAHVSWLHLDLYAWNQEGRPGRPKGGEAQGLRALFSLLSERFAPR
ncbi:M17 family metallopeptidase [Pantoea sp. 18069]|uniref:leucyl aminopeptidase family protein n=1 Tax=Pantoea sp. 18069 TaxID=2681415 RepID=UPI00135B5EAC|nr:leucyl aminopeptidase family protein [Pantoea sp. 18069]